MTTPILEIFINGILILINYTTVSIILDLFQHREHFAM